ncbi:MAG: hypothetical protein IT453_20720 [Planctomycetes bacterium]|nr:hypothetical protein [Planctomycetota bacterium]
MVEPRRSDPSEMASVAPARQDVRAHDNRARRSDFGHPPAPSTLPTWVALTAPATRSILCSMSDRARQSSDTSGTSLSVSLPSEMRAFVDDAVAREHFGSASEFIRELIRRAQRARDKEEFELKLLQSLGSGSGIRADAKFWKRKRSRLEKRHGTKRRKAE